jgi:GT2 family glycosyltransferase
MISVIIPCYYSHTTLRACLESLQSQTFQDLETIVIDSTPELDASYRIAGEFAGMQRHRHPERLGAHAARNLGAEMAHGGTLAFLDPDMTADPRWLERLGAAHRSGRAVVGSGVDCPPGYWVGAVHLTKYGWWLPGGAASTRPQLPSGGLSVRRELFLSLGGFPARFWEGDTELSDRLRKLGYSLWHEPGAITVHHDAPSVGGFLAERWARGYDTACARAARGGWTRLMCAARLAAAPVVWVLMMARSFRYVAAARRGLAWLGASPVIGVGLAAWVAGECRAYGEMLCRR